MLDSRFVGNRRKLTQFVFALSLLLFVTLTNAHAQTTTFGQFFQRSGSDRNYVFTNNGDGTATFDTVAGGNPVFFLYSGINSLPSDLQGIQSATIIRNSSTDVAASFNSTTGNYTQSLNQISVTQVIRDTAAAEGGGTRRNLLTITVTENTSTGDLVGSGNAITYSASTPQQFVTFTSDFLDFTQTNSRNFSLSLSGVNPALSLGQGGLLSSFAASGTGTVASNPVPFYDPPTAAAVNISGRILTADGRGVSRAQVTLTNADGTTRVVSSNVFGYYRFNGVDAGQTVVVSVAAKRYTFAPQIISVSSEMTGLNFTAR